MAISARYLIDSGVLLRFFAEDDPLNPLIVADVTRRFASGSRIYFTPQVAREAWAVFTRPENVGGYGLPPEDTAGFLDKAHKTFDFVADTDDVYVIWLDLVRTCRVSGRQVHDAYHVAAMKAHGLTKVLTLDKRDFARYEGIEVIVPENL